jgi:hypothetical protein
LLAFAAATGSSAADGSGIPAITPGRVILFVAEVIGEFAFDAELYR